LIWKLREDETKRKKDDNPQGINAVEAFCDSGAVYKGHDTYRLTYLQRPRELLLYTKTFYDFMTN